MNKNTENLFLCYKNGEGEQEFTPICDVLAFGAPTEIDGSELELMNESLYVFSEDKKRFVPLD